MTESWECDKACTLEERGKDRTVTRKIQGSGCERRDGKREEERKGRRTGVRLKGEKTRQQSGDVEQDGGEEGQRTLRR